MPVPVISAPVVPFVSTVAAAPTILGRGVARNVQGQHFRDFWLVLGKIGQQFLIREIQRPEIVPVKDRRSHATSASVLVF